MIVFALSSPAFASGAAIPARFTADGPDLSPPLEWSGPPEGTKSFALLVTDPDAPAGTWIHWILIGIPPDLRRLPEGVDTKASPTGIAGAKNGKNSFGDLGWGGPSPPRGKPHRYFFKLYALDAPLSLGAGATREQLLESMKGHILAAAETMGTYQRK